jgi:hypothetical protein
MRESLVDLDYSTPCAISPPISGDVGLACRTRLMRVRTGLCRHDTGIEIGAESYYQQFLAILPCGPASA